jgi:hypothetical protein
MYHCSWPEVGYRMWRDESDVKGSDVIIPEVGDSPWVWSYLFEVLCCTPTVFSFHVLLLTVVFLLNDLRAADQEVCATGAADRGIYTTAADGDRDICRHRRSSSNTHRVRRKNPIIFWKRIIRFCFGFQTIRSRSCHAMGTSIYNIKHMMTPKPDGIWWCYGKYQIYGIVEGI